MAYRYVLLISALFGILVDSSSAWALSSLTYQGRILRPDGTPLESNPVTVTVQIRSPGSEDCLLYQETHQLDMRDSSGVFTIPVGNGTRVGSSVDGGFPLSTVFANRSTLLGPLPVCAFGASYTPNAADTRKLKISFNDGTGVQTLQTQTMSFVPYAIEAQQVAGYDISKLLRAEVPTASLTAEQYTEFGKLIAGTSTKYGRANQLGGYNLPPISAGQSLRWNGSVWEAYAADSVVTSITAGTGLGVGAGIGGTITSAGTLRLTDTGVTAGTYGGAASIPQFQVDAQGRLIAVSNVPLNSVANFSGSLAGDVSGDQGTTSVDRIKGVAVSGAAPATGQILRHDGTGWAPQTPNVAMLVNSAAEAQFPTNCTDAETLTFDSLGDKFVCTPISVSAFSGSLSGDVSGLQNATIVSAVGGVTAANVASGATLANNATSANTASALVRRDGSGNFAAGNITATTFTGDLTGTATNTTQIQGRTVDPAAPTGIGQLLRWDGVKYAPEHLRVQDLKNSLANPQIPTNCSTTEVMIYDAFDDAFECQAISLANTSDIMTGDVTGSVSTNTVTALQGRAVSSGAPSAGQNLKWNGAAWAPANELWTVNSTDVGYMGGSVGIGTTTPAHPLDVQGSIRATAHDNGASRTFDWTQGNVQYTTSACDGTPYTMDNVIDGASYTLIVKAATHTGACLFTGSGVVSWRFRPTAVTPRNGFVVLTLLRAGDDVFVSWVDGF